MILRRWSPTKLLICKVIVKVAEIHLTPDKPKYEGGVWHVEGMKNEDIVSTGRCHVETYLSALERVFSFSDLLLRHSQHHSVSPQLSGCRGWSRVRAG